MDVGEIGRRGRRLFGDLASTYAARGDCVVARIIDAAELTKNREPYRRQIIFGRAKTFRAAFAMAEKHVADKTPDWLLEGLYPTGRRDGLL
jgi:hypothetical protein